MITTISLNGVNLTVEFDHQSNPGIHTFPNGDPGVPSYDVIDILSVESNTQNIIPLFGDNIIKSIEEMIKEQLKQCPE